MKSESIPSLTLAALIVTFTMGCDLGQPYVPPRIIPGVSVDGVQVGDSRNTVEYKIGAVSGLGNADGTDRGWFQADYKSGPHAGLSIDYYDLGGVVGQVDLIVMRAPYEGKTQEGIGLGSALRSVHENFGVPRNITGPPGYRHLVEAYCFQGKFFELEYEDCLVIYMSMGFFVPPAPWDSIHQCN